MRPRQKTRHAGDRIGAGILLVVAVILLISSVRYDLFESGRPGPGLFPAIVSGALVLNSLAWLVAGAGPPDGSRAASSPEVDGPGPTGPLADAGALEHPLAAAVEAEAAEEEPIDAAGAKRIAFVVIWSLVPLLLLEPIGYLLTMTLYVGGLLVLVARVRPWLGIVAAALGAGVTAYGADALGIVFPDPFSLLSILGI